MGSLVSETLRYEKRSLIQAIYRQFCYARINNINPVLVGKFQNPFKQLRVSSEAMRFECVVLRIILGFKINLQVFILMTYLSNQWEVVF